jgi:hypothetical protein
VLAIFPSSWWTGSVLNGPTATPHREKEKKARKPDIVLRSSLDAVIPILLSGVFHPLLCLSSFVIPDSPVPASALYSCPSIPEFAPKAQPPCTSKTVKGGPKISFQKTSPKSQRGKIKEETNAKRTKKEKKTRKRERSERNRVRVTQNQGKKKRESDHQIQNIFLFRAWLETQAQKERRGEEISHILTALALHGFIASLSGQNRLSLI